MGRDKTENTEQGKITRSYSHFPPCDARKFANSARPVLSISSLTSNELNFKWKNNRNPRTPDGVKILTNSNDNLIPSIPLIFLVIDDQVLT